MCLIIVTRPIPLIQVEQKVQDIITYHKLYSESSSLLCSALRGLKQWRNERIDAEHDMKQWRNERIDAEHDIKRNEGIDAEHDM